MLTKIPNLNQEILIFDGAMGTMLQKSGALKPGGSPELLNLERPEVVRSIHQAYVEAGSKCIQTNTFGGNRTKLQLLGLEDKIREINMAGVRIAKEAASNGCLVAASLGPVGKMLEPLGDLPFAAAYRIFLEQCRIFAEAGADLINIETMSDIMEAKAALIAALEVNLPVMVSVSFLENGRLLNGFTPEMAAATLSGFPVLALGTNCGLSASQLKPIVQKLIAYSQKPLIVKPNAGKPALIGMETVYRENATEFAFSCLELVKMGARVIGGCCGTTPEYLQILTDTLKNHPVVNLPVKAEDYLTGKSTLLAAATPLTSAEIWELHLRSGDPLLIELSQGRTDSMIDLLLSIDHTQKRAMEINGLDLSEGEADVFQKLVQLLTTYWPHPINAKLHSRVLIEVFLTSTPGRSIVTTGSGDTGTIKTIFTHGGIFHRI